MSGSGESTSDARYLGSGALKPSTLPVSIVCAADWRRIPGSQCLPKRCMCFGAASATRSCNGGGNETWFGLWAEHSTSAVFFHTDPLLGIDTMIDGLSEKKSTLGV